MQLKPFLLDMWLDTYEHDIEFNLAASEGPRWTLNEILSLASEEERQRFLNHKLAYSRPAGAEGLRAAIADMQDVHRRAGPSRNRRLGGTCRSDVAGRGTRSQRCPASTRLSALFPPCPNPLGSRFATTRVRKENDFRIDLEEIKQLVDRNTKLILVNSPHNPTGGTISDAELDSLHEFTASREIQLVSDEVFHSYLSWSADQIGFPSAACDRHP